MYRIPMYADVHRRVDMRKKEVNVFTVRKQILTIDVVYTYIIQIKYNYIFISMAHKVFIRHTYIYKCDYCDGEWKINEAANIERLSCPHCGTNAGIEYVREDQRRNYRSRHV